mmetsp:Transcript_16557/g.47529  ORF Transcript_16557/g.47529 Transcript_16557/m.47529 type:complete len:211 (-) Transcript_16557:512-1144(-)
MEFYQELCTGIFRFCFFLFFPLPMPFVLPLTPFLRPRWTTSTSYPCLFLISSTGLAYHPFLFFLFGYFTCRCHRDTSLVEFSCTLLHQDSTSAQSLTLLCSDSSEEVIESKKGIFGRNVRPFLLFWSKDRRFSPSGLNAASSIFETVSFTRPGFFSFMALSCTKFVFCCIGEFTGPRISSSTFFSASASLSFFFFFALLPGRVGIGLGDG